MTKEVTMRGHKRDRTKLCSENKKKGQLNIEFTGGAILFFITLIFLLGTVLSNIPKHTDQARTNQLALVSSSLSDKLIGHKGYYDTGTSEGSRWEDHSDDLVSLGLAESPHRLAQDKIDAFSNLDLTDESTKAKVQSALGLRQLIRREGIEHDTNISYNLNLTRLVPVKTTKTFNKGDGSIYGINEPNSGSCDYIGLNDSIHYGSRAIQGDDYHILIGNHQDTANYDRYWISVNEKDFTDSDPEIGDDMCYEIPSKLGDNVYVGSDGDYFLGQRSGVEASRGNLIVFQRKMISKGPGLPSVTENVIQTRRYATLGNDTVKLVLQVWRR